MSSKKIMKQLGANEINRSGRINTSKNGNQHARITTINKTNQNFYENSKQANLINDQFQDKNKIITHISSKKSNKKINQIHKEPSNKDNHKTQLSKKNVRAGIKKQEQFLGGQQKKIIKNNKDDDGCKHFENDVNDNNFNKNILNNNNFILNAKIKKANNNPNKILSNINVNNNQIDNSNFDNNHIIIQNHKINQQINNSPIKPSFWSVFDKKPPLIVLLNYGNTTYINVCIQCFANIRNISSYYIKISFDKIKQNVPVTRSFSNILYNLFPTSITNYKGSYPLENFYKLIITLNPIFKGKSTKSAIDFLIYFIDKLNDEMEIIIGDNKHNTIKQTYFQDFNEYLKYLNRTNLNKNIIFQTFSWINEKVEKCWECNKEQKSFQIYNTYDLDFENALTKTIINYENEITINNCIKYNSEEKTIYNVFCKNCNKKNNINVKSNICLTQNLLIFLFRGLEKKDIRNKLISNKIHIKIEENIDLSQFIEIKIDSFTKYTLHGLILFDTEKLEYLAYCVSPIDSKWYKYNNGSIEQIQPSDLNNFRNFYDYKLYPAILFYRHLK